jgi:hypothetical protein
VPPAAGVRGHLRGSALGQAPGAQLAIGSRTPPPMFQVDGSETVADPFIQVSEDARRIRQPEVLLPQPSRYPRS